MGRKRYAALLKIEHEKEITWDNAAEFLHQLEIGLLLALKEDGFLTQTQYQYGETTLKQHWQNCEKKHQRSET